MTKVHRVSAAVLAGAVAFFAAAFYSTNSFAAAKGPHNLMVWLSTTGATGQALVRLLGRNEIITLVADRDLAGRGVRVEMFGAPRLLPAGPAYLLLMTGAPMSAAAIFTTDQGWHCVIEPPLEVDR